MASHPKCAVTGKRKYTSVKQARMAMKKAGNRFRVYVCRHCNAYHVTSSMPR